MSPAKCFAGIWSAAKSREGWQLNQNKNPQEAQKNTRLAFWIFRHRYMQTVMSHGCQAEKKMGLQCYLQLQEQNATDLHDDF